MLGTSPSPRGSFSPPRPCVLPAPPGAFRCPGVERDFAVRGTGGRGMPRGVGKIAQTSFQSPRGAVAALGFGRAVSLPQTHQFPSGWLYFPLLDSQRSRQTLAAVFSVSDGDFGKDLPLASANPRFCLLLPRPKSPLRFFSYFSLLCV